MRYVLPDELFVCCKTYPDLKHTKHPIAGPLPREILGNRWILKEKRWYVSHDVILITVSKAAKLTLLNNEHTAFREWNYIDMAQQSNMGHKEAYSFLIIIPTIRPL